MAAKDTITHFSRPGHELVKRHYMGPFRCDICQEDLSGLAYGCGDVAIHDACAAHPQTTFFTAAHPHPLVLLRTRRDAAHGCGVCAGRCAPGCFLYRCPPCGFDMHPRCAKLPPAVRSARHPAHDLALAAADGRCAACHQGGRAWFYRCSTCNVDLHVSCAASGGGGDQSARAGGHGGGNQQYVQGAGQGVARDVHSELLLARIKAQNDMAAAIAMRNAGDSIWSQFFCKFPLKYYRIRR